MGGLIGRAGDLAALEAMLERGQRIVTLLGPAGIGKTSLAIALIERTGDSCFVDLTAAASGADIAVETARALELSEVGEETLVRALAARPGLVLVLDNLEHLLPGAAPIVAAWSRAAPEMTIVATSRETLRVSGEAIYELAPLPEAVELFVARVREVEPAYAPDATERAIIAKIVALLERIPLAIELAAARASVLSPAELLARLDDRFAVLSAGPRDRAPRQATMYGAIEWSWLLLDQREQRALVAAAVFRGGFTVDALDAVLSDRSIELVQSLRAKSLLRREPGGRLGMYEVIREFTKTKLAPEAARSLELAHAHYYVALPDPSAERENLAAVLAHAAAADDATLDLLGLRAAIALDVLSAGDGITDSHARALEVLLVREEKRVNEFLSPPRAESGERNEFPLSEKKETANEFLSPPCAESGERNEFPLSQGGEGSSRSGVFGRALLVKAGRLFVISRLEEAERVARNVLAIAGEDEALAAAALGRLATVLFSLGRIEEAAEEARRAIEIYRRLGDKVGEAQSLTQEGGALSSLNRGDEALELFERAISIARAQGAQRVELSAEAGIAFRWLELGRYEPARKHYERCLELAQNLGARRMTMLVTGYLGVLGLDHGRLLDALEHSTLAVAEARERGETRAEGVFASIAAAARAALGEVDEAERNADAAEKLLTDHPFFLRVAEIHRGHVELAKSREAATHGDLVRWKKLRAAARARLESGERAIEHSDDARIAVRILSRAFDRASSTDPAPAPPASTAAIELAIARDASWFEIGTNGKVDVSRRGALKSLIALLAARRENTPGEPIAIDDLLAAGWPGEKLLKSAALNRLHVALATLRSLGLKELLERRGEGYLLPARVKITRAQ